VGNLMANPELIMNDAFASSNTIIKMLYILPIVVIIAIITGVIGIIINISMLNDKPWKNRNIYVQNAYKRYGKIFVERKRKRAFVMRVISAFGSLLLTIRNKVIKNEQPK
jgi:hypothetical protein